MNLGSRDRLADDPSEAWGVREESTGQIRDAAAKGRGMYDFVIVGSGVSGARIAYELTKGGAKCVLLEAGKSFDRHNFPDNEMESSVRMFWGGGLEVSKDARLGFLRAKCLGGTSVVNQADLDRFDDIAFDAWRDQTGVDFFSTKHFDPLYDHLDGCVVKGEIPRQYYNRNAELFIEAFGKRGLHWKPIVRGQSDCRLDMGSDCIVCLGGCPRDAKQSAIVALLPQARAQGLTIETEFEAMRVEHLSDQVRVQGKQRGVEREFAGRRAVLACGSFGNVALLSRSKPIASKLPALGSQFCCHPQFMTYGVHSETINAHKGALQSVQAHDENLRKKGIKFENVFAGPVATAMLMPGFGAEHYDHMRKFRNVACVEIAVRDEPVGKIALDRAGKLVVDKPLTDADRAKIRQGLDIAYDLHHSVGVKEIIRCEQGFGLHLMGGCPIGVDPNQSVVGPDFRLHGFPNLLSADSSVYPSAPGINPSYTIMALSYKASQMMLAG